jgi:CRP/FNR family transcriptional regulator, dissimilatory nitrate respiration regulator
MRTVRSTGKQRTEFLDVSEHFSKLKPREKQAMAAFTALRNYDAGECLFHQEQTADGFHVIVEGEVNVHRLGVDGREQVLHLMRRGDLCGEVPVFEGDRYPAAARAVGTVQTLYIPRDGFLALCRKQPDILLEILAELSRRLRRFVGLIDDLSLKEVSARLAKYLLDLSVHTQSNEVQLDSTKAMLAARLGTIAETLSRTLKKMQTRKVIDVRGKGVTILDREALVDLAAGERL